MTNHSVPKAFYSLVMFAGLAATASAPQAADIGMPVLELPKNTVAAQPQRPALPTHQTEASRSVDGAQGPIRTDDFSNEKQAKADAEMLRRDLRMNRYPMNGGIGIP